MNRRPRVLLGVTGSIAAVKAPRLAIRLATELKADVKVVLTRTVEQYFWKEGKACETYDPACWTEFRSWVDGVTDKSPSFSSTAVIGSATEGDWRLTNGTISVHYAEEEWNNYTSLNDRVLHIDLRNWADICIVAPLSAHTLAKIANGMCDDLLTCCLRAWDFGQWRRPFANRESNDKQHGTSQSFGDGGNDATITIQGKPLILAPAMNTAMWDHPLTQMQLETIQNFCKLGATKRLEQRNLVTIVDPAVKTLACGEVGAGALADLDDIISTAQKYLKLWSSEVVPNVGSNSPTLCKNKSCAAKFSEGQSESLSSKKESMKKALILFAKEKFREMQASHQHENQQSSKNDLMESSAEPMASVLAAPISPTPELIIKSVLHHIKLDKGSLLIDLGCGDGRWLIAASKRTNCRCLGIDTDDERLQKANDAIRKSGLDVNGQVQVRNQDIFDFIKCDNDMFSAADVIVLYLFREAMVEIGRLLLSRFEKDRKQHNKALQIICVGFGIPGWNSILEKKICGIKVYLYSEP